MKILKKRKNAIIPKKATSGSAGFDLCACIDKPVEIKPGDILKIPTGIAIELSNSNYVATIFSRSSLGVMHGISLSNGVGIIDSDYRGEICVGLCNIGASIYTIEPMQRIAQMIIMKIPSVFLTEVSCLNDTKRGIGGFGSTGK